MQARLRFTKPEEAALPIMHFAIDQFVKTPSGIGIKTALNLGNQVRFCPIHCFAGHPFDDTGSRDDDQPTPHFVEEAVKQEPSVNDARRLLDQLRHDLRAQRLA